VEPDKQIEIQLGHMCNNRCVFCVSGQRTAMREAFPVPAEPILAQIRAARAQGMTKLTLLGGEPTLQPDFKTIVQESVALGFDEIVIFSNGVKTARASYIDEVLALGGNFTWRLSFQGGNALAHERTTKKLGSFRRLVDTLGHLRERGQRITVNMCVVQSNFASVADFPTLLLPYGVSQIHLDMVRPLDAGVRTEEEMRAMLPRYADLVPALETMVAGFPAGFDANIGNLPYCVAPGLAPWIHHDGEQTLTVAIDEQDTVSEPWNKYEVKRRDKIKKPSCATCLFDSKCNGVFETYERFYGMDEFVPVTRERLTTLDPAMRLFTMHVQPFVDRIEGWTPPGALASPTIHTNSRDGEVTLRFATRDGRDVVIAMRRPGGGVAGTDRFSLHVVAGHEHGGAVVELLRAMLARFVDAGGCIVTHPPALDAVVGASPSRTNGNPLDWRIAACLGRLRARAPFGELVWRDVVLHDEGARAVVALADPDGVGVEFTLAVKNGSVASGYRLDRAVAAPAERLVHDVRAVFDALRSPA